MRNMASECSKCSDCFGLLPLFDLASLLLLCFIKLPPEKRGRNDDVNLNYFVRSVNVLNGVNVNDVYITCNITYDSLRSLIG